MPRKLNFGNVVLCEHVVASGNNKHTLINVYAGDVVVPGFPAKLTFGIYIEVLRNEHMERLTLFLRNGAKEMGKAEAIFAEPENGVLTIPLLPFQAEAETTFEIVAASSGYARASILKKRIFAAGS